MSINNTNSDINRNIVIAITGASGSIYAIRLLEYLKEFDNIHTHLVISNSAYITINQETDYTIKDVIKLADFSYNIKDIGAAIASGSFKTDGMIIAPCSMKSLSAIANGFEDNLIIRAASVAIKEKNSLSLMVRETPFSPIHLENMLKLSRIGVNICPTVTSFYNKPKSIDDIVNHTIGRVLNLHNIDNSLYTKWNGLNSSL